MVDLVKVNETLISEAELFFQAGVDSVFIDSVYITFFNASDSILIHQVFDSSIKPDTSFKSTTTIDIISSSFDFYSLSSHSSTDDIYFKGKYYARLNYIIITDSIHKQGSLITFEE